MEELLEKFREKFNMRVDEDDKFRNYLEGKDRRVQIDLTDGTGYFMELKESVLGPVMKGIHESPDITMSADLETFTGILKGEVKVIRAYAKKQFKIKAAMKDIMILKKMLPKKSKRT